MSIETQRDSQWRWDHASPPERRYRPGNFEWHYRSVDGVPEVSIVFGIEYGSELELLGVEYMAGNVWFGDDGWRLDPFGHGDDRTQRAVQWFRSMYERRDWFRDEVDAAIRKDAEGR